MFKIIHIINRLDMGGSARNTLLTCRELSHKHEIVLAHGFSRESKMSDSEKRVLARNIEEAAEQGVRFIRISSLVRRINVLRDCRALFSLFWLIFKEKPAIVHTHSSKAGILGRLAAKLAGVPILVHTPHGHVFYGHFGPLVSRLFQWFETIFAVFTDRLVALTDGERKDYIILSVGRPEKMATIHSGVDVGLYANRHVNVIGKKRSLGISPNAILIGFIGRLLPTKGPTYLLKAMPEVWKQHPEITLVFVGQGDLETDLRAEAIRMGTNGRVKFLGWRDDIAEIMPVLDMLVLPSLNEGMGRVLVEAMAAGIPAVASRVGGIPDVVEHEKTGILVPPGDVKALAKAIVRLTANPQERKEMGQRGRTVCYRFSIERMAEKTDNLYDELIFTPRKIIKLKPESFATKWIQFVQFSREHPQRAIIENHNLSEQAILSISDLITSPTSHCPPESTPERPRSAAD